MGFSAKLMRAQLNFFKPFVANCSLQTTRKAQDKLGELMEAIHNKNVLIKDHKFEAFDAAWVLPKDERRNGVVLYLHGGGYTCGDLDYAKGFAATLADRCGVRVFCPAYRLAPEHPFPAALEDALACYQYLLAKGYPARKIALCGESAGGGLLFALQLHLRELQLPMPALSIAISPWVDLTASGASYEINRDNDPSLTKELLEYYATCYTVERENPLVSPLFGDLKGLAPSLLFAGGDEILLDDTTRLHEALRKCGCKSEMHIAPERWHAYVLYDLNENQEDFDVINSFLNNYLSRENKLRWMRLDNAAKIYPAVVRKHWSNVFRLSATMKEPVDSAVLKAALDVTVRRFPSIAARLRRGIFWYYLEQVSAAPEIQEEKPYPLVHMPFDDIRRCAFRVICYQNRIAVEFFHALTDGNGALIFLKTLLAEYLTQKYSLKIPNEQGVLGRLEQPKEAELEDSFLRYAGKIAASRREPTPYHLRGTPEPDGYTDLITLMLPVARVKEVAASYGVSVTELLCAVMMDAILRLQREKERRQKPVKVLIPVNLRRLYPSESLRNFALYVTPGLDPKLGDYDFAEICNYVHNFMGMEVTAKQMRPRIAANVNSERALALKVMPLFVKNLAMRLVFDMVGERKSCLCLSNLGNVTLPAPMEEYVRRMDFIIGVQAKAPHNCGVIGYQGTMYINMIRNIIETDLEQQFFACLRTLKIPVKVESNQRLQRPGRRAH